ncbi:PAS domain-containing protein [Methylomarinum vadi]|uniref:PAS domain-containing protein n=1 Tax=Methylomarinum vadi TaxID=438855 RepID=UPI001F3CFE58|nr:PAS domain-containing protein [Methylomarinum vadi]
MRNKVESEYRNKETHLRAVINVSPTAIYILSPREDNDSPSFFTDPNCHLHLAFISAAIEKITGFTVREYLVDPKLWMSRVHPEDVANVMESYGLCQSQNAVNNQYRCLHKNGEYRWLHERLVVQRGRNGEIVQVIGSLMDVSDIVKTHEQLHILSSAVEQSPCPIFITNTKGTIEYANSKLLEITGFSEQEVLGHTPRIFSSGCTEVSIYADLWNTITAGKKWYGTIRNKKKNGQHFWVKESIAPIKNCNDETTHFVAIQEDVSTMVNASEELEQQLKDHTEKIKLLEQQRSEQRKSVAIGRMAAWVAHEINNPLAGIKNSFQLLKSAIPDTHKFFRYVDLIDKEIDRISLITKQLYSLYKQEDARAREFDCNMMIEEIILLSTLGKKQVNIDHISADKTCYVKLQENLVRQILFNLIKNAVDHSPGQSTIKIDAQRRNAELYVMIENEGTFITDEQLEKLFEPFYSTKSDSQSCSLGLGLTIVDNFVKLMHGEMKLTNKMTGGLISELTIPLDYYKNK